MKRTARLFFSVLTLLLSRELFAQAAPQTGASLVKSPSTIYGWVKDQGGKHIAESTVTLTSTSAKVTRIHGTTNGKYAFEATDAGVYLLTARSKGFRSENQSITVQAGSEGVELDLLLSPEEHPLVGGASTNELVWGGITILTYCFSILIIRLYKISLPARHILAAQIEAVRRRLVHEASRPIGKEAELDGLRVELESLESKLELETKDISLWQYLFHSQGRDNAAWTVVHEIERQLVAYFSPQDLVRASLVGIAPQLKQLQSVSANAVATEIDSELKASNPNDEFRRRLLGQALGIVYQQRDENFTSLMEWQNKASWLIFVACIIIFLVGAIGGNFEILLAGAAGGLLSRLLRVVAKQPLPLDNGASWTTFFLSPLIGALAAWFGIALMLLLANPEVRLLGGVFQIVQWVGPLTIYTIAIAFSLGFSERLFSSLVDVLDNQVKQGTGAQNISTAGIVQPGLGLEGIISTTGSSAPETARPISVLQPTSIDAATATKIRKAVKASLSERSSAKLVGFLKELGISVDESSPRSALESHSRSVGVKALSDVTFSALYVKAAEKVQLIP